MLKRILHYLQVDKDTNPEQAYNLWAKDYDNQPDNLMLALDEALFLELMGTIDITNKIVADIGCGTGRHWQKLLNKNPARLFGFDVSKKMLAILQQKYPQAKTQLLLNNKLALLANESCHLIVSTLTIAHIQDAGEALQEWNRILKPGGEIIITDYHPAALAKGGKRTFMQDGKTVSIKNYIHPIKKILDLAKQHKLQLVRIEEKIVDEAVKHYYEKQNRLSFFETMKGTPIIYALHLKKGHAVI